MPPCRDRGLHREAPIDLDAVSAVAPKTYGGPAQRDVRQQTVPPSDGLVGPVDGLALGQRVVNHIGQQLLVHLQPDLYRGVVGDARETLLLDLRQARVVAPQPLTFV